MKARLASLREQYQLVADMGPGECETAKVRCMTLCRKFIPIMAMCNYLEDEDVDTLKELMLDTANLMRKLEGV